jgi:glutamate/tyrosine decarboxylase-like PLP-dependent enzyme
MLCHKKTKVALYADHNHHTKAFRRIASECDTRDLQQAWSNLMNWSSNNNISFNESKGLFIWEEVIPVSEKTFRLAK